MRKKLRLGEMLVKAGLLAERDLPAILDEQKKSGLRLGQYLVKKGLVQEEEIIQLIGEQLKIDRFSPSKFPVDVSLADLLSGDAAKRQGVLPLAKRGHLLKVAMTDPLDINALDAIEFDLNIECDPVICTEQEFAQLHNALYGVRSELDDALENLSSVEYGEYAQEHAGSDVELSTITGVAEDAPVIRLVNSILYQAVQDGASDVHISPERNYVQVRFRIDGKLQEVPAPPKHLVQPIVSRFKILANLDISLTRIPQDGRFSIKIDSKEINVRVSSLPTIYGENLVLRLLNVSSRAITLENLGMRDEDRAHVLNALGRPYGMILATGPTGSGKSTSLYACLDKVNKPDINIVTLEDPVEYRVEGIRQVQLNRRAGMTFASGLRSILRQDPDVIMVGEIRDAETAQIGVQAAQTGHRVLSTVHTNDAASVVTRLGDMGIEPFLIANTLLLAIAQRLVRTICPYCKEQHTPPEAALKAWGLQDVDPARFMRGRGCPKCMNTGYKGRTGIYEMLPIDEEIQELIIQRKSAGEIKRNALARGKMRTLKDDAARKVAEGLTTLEEAASAVMV